jgi:hypothetical protein
MRAPSPLDTVEPCFDARRSTIGSRPVCSGSRAQTYLAAKPVHAFLQADANLGENFRAGMHGMTAEDWSALLDFADQSVMKKPNTRKFDVIPRADQRP